jgi:predicted ATPase
VLPEREEPLALLEAALARAREGHGHTFLIGGEAGIGKTSLLETFAAERARGARVLWGACEALATPRPLGPLVDIAEEEEGGSLRSQTVTLKGERGPASRSRIVTLKRGAHMKYLPLVFTEQGVAMLSSVLRSARAVVVNIEIMRAFVRLREALATNRELAKHIDQLERRIEKRLADQDQAIVEILRAIRQLMAPPTAGPKRRIGFV